MPSTETILNGLAAIANDWRWLAIAWHVLLAALFASLFAGWRPSIRLTGYLLVAPLSSVSFLAWLSGNPFNGIAFGVLAATLVWAATRVSNPSVRLASPAWAAVSVALISVGWTYPHFVKADSWTTYLYAAPFGLLPCPTLSVVIGMTLLLPSLCSRLWCAALLVTGLLYGALGVFGLGVALDWGLLVGSALLAGAAAHRRRNCRSVRADRSEQTRAMDARDRQPAHT